MGPGRFSTGSGLFRGGQSMKAVQMQLEVPSQALRVPAATQT